MIGRRSILTGGAGLLALGGLGVTGIMLALDRGRAAYDSYSQTIRRRLPQEPTALDLVRYATLAPNSHNTQPWIFRSSNERIDITPDMSRSTPAVDSDNHHLYISLGCALENLSLAASAAGRPGRIELLEGGRAGAGLVFSCDRSASMQTMDRTLFDAIPQRQSTRGLYDGKPVSAKNLDALKAAAGISGVGLALLTDRAVIDNVRDLAVAGNSRQIEDPAFRRELREWLRFSPTQAMDRGDGLYAPATGNPALPAWLGPLAFDLAFSKSAENEKLAQQVDSSAGLAVFSAETEGVVGWIAVGRACQRFCLMATALGMRQAFINQPVEVVDLRRELSDLAGFPARRPDLLLRFGYGPGLPFAPRRDPAEVTLA